MTEKRATVKMLAEMVSGQVEGDETVELIGFAPLNNADVEEISFLAKEKDATQLGKSNAGAFIVPLAVQDGCGKPLIRVKDPYLAVAIIHNYFIEKPFVSRGVHPQAFIGENCNLNSDITIGPMAVIGDRVTIAERVTIEAGAVIGDDVKIDADSTIKSNATIAHESTIGARVTIHSGTVVGSDGYGYSTNERGEHVKRPQVGTVCIEDDVEIGANCAIDRAAYGITLIKSGAKVDNLVQVAHNVVIGENSLIVAQVGLAGSTILGRNVVMGGQSGTKGHITLEDRVMVAARGGVHNNQSKGAIIGGTPAIPVRNWAKSCAIFARLPELQKNVRRNTKALASQKDEGDK